MQLSNFALEIFCLTWFSIFVWPDSKIVLSKSLVQLPRIQLLFIIVNLSKQIENQNIVYNILLYQR